MLVKKKYVMYSIKKRKLYISFIYVWVGNRLIFDNILEC